MDKIYVVESGTTWKYETKNTCGHFKSLVSAQLCLEQCLIDMDEYKETKGDMPYDNTLVLWETEYDFYCISEVKLDD